MYNRDEVVEFALRQVIEGGMKPTHAARMAVDKFKRYTSCYICDFVTKHPRYKEFRDGKPAGPGIIPMEVLGGADGVKRGRYKTGLDSSDCILDLSIDELVRRGYLSRAKE